MAENFTARKQGGWRVVSIVPDVCKTPMGSSTPEVPYQVTAELCEAVQPAATVRANRCPVIVYDMSLAPVTIGDEAGTALGVKSETVGGKCYPIDHSTTVRAEKKFIVRAGDKFWMNGE